MADLLDRNYFQSAARELMQDHIIRARAFGVEDGVDIEVILERYAAAGESIRPLVCDTAYLLRDAMKSGKNLLFEGAQGTMLDIDHGTYPFVTSSSACAGGACTGTGVPPTKIDVVIGISKVYITRVGGGPFPTEALDGRGDQIRNRGREFGSVTGRPRRCGWFDVPLLRYSAALNGFGTMVLTKLDVLDELPEIPVCVGYKIDGVTTREMPATVRELARVEPVFEVLPGWQSSTEGISDWDELPAAARQYISFLEDKTGVEAGCISTGPERNQTVRRANTKFAAATA
jgi:adenylosuccinate synthase